MHLEQFSMLATCEVPVIGELYDSWFALFFAFSGKDTIYFQQTVS